MGYPPHIRRRRKDALAGQVLGVRVRRDNQPPAAPPRLTLHRVMLLNAIADKQIRRGHGSFAREWRWAGVTVTKSVQPFTACGWAHEVGAHLELTDAGRAALDTAGGMS